jgi:hypothetical protein
VDYEMNQLKLFRSVSTLASLSAAMLLAVGVVLFWSAPARADDDMAEK